MSTTQRTAYSIVFDRELELRPFQSNFPELLISSDSNLRRILWQLNSGELPDVDCFQLPVMLKHAQFSDVDQMMHLLSHFKSFERLSISRVVFDANPNSSSVRHPLDGIKHLCVDYRDSCTISRHSLIRLLQCLPDLTSLAFRNVIFPPRYTVSYSDDDTLPLSQRAQPRKISISTVHPINFRSTLTCICDTLNLQGLRQLQLKVESSASSDEYNSCRGLFELSELLKGSEGLQSLDIGFHMDEYLDKYLTKPEKLGFLRMSIHSRASCSQQLQWLRYSLQRSSRRNNTVKIQLARRQSLQDFEEFYDDWFDLARETTATIEIPFPVQGEAREMIKGYLARGFKKSRYTENQVRVGWLSSFHIQVLPQS